MDLRGTARPRSERCDARNRNLHCGCGSPFRARDGEYSLRLGCPAATFAVRLRSEADLSTRSIVRWGVVGLGGVVVDSVAPAIVASSGSRLVACAGRNLDNARDVAREFSAERAYATQDELFADPEVELVYIATPNALHKDAVLAAARAGKHVLCEKPLALTVEDGREMDAACRSAGVILRVAFQIRLERMLIRVREIIASGALGELRTIGFERTAPLTQRGAWRHELRQGGVLFDVATHLLDLVPWLTGLSYREISAMSHPDRREGKPDDTIAILARLGDHCNAVIRASREIPFAKNDLIVEGTKGMLTTSPVRYVDEYWLQVKDASGVREERFVPTPIYQREVEVMEGELRGERSLLPGAEEAIQMIALADAIFESIETRRIVPLPR
jgi:1,5-anhydro-D-fructose reductase (1,5-anhydro-D-mannitol-forming)